jgi:regulator of protease activity HflC (stomatin/prohibitin superfamily)
MDGLMSFLGCLFPLGVVGIIGIFFVIVSNIRQINEYQRGVLFQKGKYKGTVGPGWTFVIPILQTLKIIDIRTKTVDLSGQDAMTKDNISVQLGIVLYYRIADAAKSLLQVENSKWATSQLAESTMRSVVGEVDLNELLGERERIAQRIQQIIESMVDDWGVDIASVEIKDVNLPENMKRTMAKQAEAEREKLSIVTKSEGEKLASQNLTDAARLMSEVPGALHLRTLSTINDVSSDQSNTIMFALPIEVLIAIEGMGAKVNPSSGESEKNSSGKSSS